VNELSRDVSGIRETEFIAKGASGAGIEFYIRDFNYKEEKGFKASVMIDREGDHKQNPVFHSSLPILLRS
jgi:hypothetical protein